MKLCDLHTHSVFSDGTMTPEQLIDEAVGAGLYAIALTDHNVVEGLERFLSYAADKPIEAVPGIEFTTSYKGQELHILGLFLPRESYEAVTEYVRLAHERKEVSNLILASRLNENGYPIDYEKLKAARPDGKVNRAHFAAALVDAGLIESRDEAFRTILSPSYGWYEEYERLDTLTTIRFIRSLGAVPVWAHPLFHVDRQTCEELIPAFKVNGLVGVETIYSTYTEDDTAFLKKICSKYELLESGGSDFHGANKPDITIGTGRGNLRIPYSFYENLLERRNKNGIIQQLIEQERLISKKTCCLTTAISLRTRGCWKRSIPTTASVRSTATRRSSTSMMISRKRSPRSKTCFILRIRSAFALGWRRRPFT